MGALEDYIRPQRKVKNRNDPMRDSVMSRPASPEYVPEYVREPGLEAPMVSPDDLIGTGIPSKLAALAGKALGAKSALGMVGMLMGRRGAERLGNQRFIDLLGAEMEKAASLKRAGQEYRMRHNVGDPATYTGFDGKPRLEVSDSLFLPYKKDLVFDKEVPFLSQWKVPENIEKAYGDELANLRVVNSTHPDDPINSGAFDGNTNVMTIGYGPSSDPASRAIYQEYPFLVDQKAKNTAAHELTHFIQRAERWTGGTSPENLGQIMNSRDMTPQLERHLLRGNYLDILGGNSMAPEDAYQFIASQGVDSGTLRQLKNYLQAFKEGRLTPEDALDQSKFHQDAASNLMNTMQERETLRNLAPGIRKSARNDVVTANADSYGMTGRNKGESVEDAANRYLLYRANAGEQEAEAVLNRLNLNLQQKRNQPFVEEFDFPVEFTHSIR